MTSLVELQVIDFDLADITRFDSDVRQAHSYARLRTGGVALSYALPVVRLYAIEAGTGLTRVIYIHDCAPYLYLGAPPAEDGFDESHCAMVQNFLNNALNVQVLDVQLVRDKYDLGQYCPDTCSALKVTVSDPKMVPRLRSFWLGDGDEGGHQAPPLMLHGLSFPRKAWEADVQFYRRVCLDAQIAPLSWIALPRELLSDLTAGMHLFVEQRSIRALGYAGQYARISPDLRVALFDIECLGRGSAFPEARRDPVISIATVVCQGCDCKGVLDAVVFITRGTNYSGAEPPPDTPESERVRFRVQEAPDERSMLIGWAGYMRECARMHVVGGYNTDRFDWEYLFTRADTLGCGSHVRRVSPWAPNELAEMKSTAFQSKAYGRSEDKDLRIPGVLNVDVFRPIKREKKLRSYKLGAVAAEFLKKVDDRVMGKKDMPYSQIPAHYFGSPSQRWTLCDYNEWDARLCAMLIDSLKILNNLFAMARVTGVDVTELICGGQQVKVHMQLLADALRTGYLVPTRWRPPRKPDEQAKAPPPDETPQQRREREEAERYDMVDVAGQFTLMVCPRGGLNVAPDFQRVRKRKTNNDRRPAPAYEGATVIDPVRGFYGKKEVGGTNRSKAKRQAAVAEGSGSSSGMPKDARLVDDPITTLDFSSLYPSIMIEHNLSYDSRIVQPRLCSHGHCMLTSEEVLKCCVTRTPVGARFVRTHVREGMLPRVLKKLLAERSVAKRAMGAAKAAGDSAGEAVHDGMQLALKISANSVYGFTGATVGKLPCTDISASVTAYGRDMIHFIKDLVERVFTQEHGYLGDAKVVYGDSVALFEKIWLKLPEPPAPGSPNAADPLWARLEGGADVTIEEAFTTLCDKESVVWHGDKESAVPRRPLLCRSKSGWVPLARVIRHKLPPGKQMAKLGFVGDVGAWTEWRRRRPHADLPPEPDINDGAGVCVTADHSLLRADGSVVSAVELSAQMIRDSQIKLDCPPDDSQLAPYRLLSAAPVRSRTGVPEVLQVASLYNVTSKFDANSYVYDLQTEDHTFMVGSRGLIVHNTDSIMVRFGVPSVADAISYGKQAAVLINAAFKERNLTDLQLGQLVQAIAGSADAIPDITSDTKAAHQLVMDALEARPAAVAELINATGVQSAINIIFEKALFPYLLINKKRYAGGFWTNAAKMDKIHHSGLESVRRDNSLYANRLIADVIDTLMQTASIEAAVELARERVSDLARGRVPMEDLVVSKGYTRRVEDYADGHKRDANGCYAGAQVHLRVNELRKARGQQSYKMGERIPYVFVEREGQLAMSGPGKKKSKQCDFAEDVDYAMERNLRPNAGHYIETIRKPLTRIFDTALGQGATSRLVLEPNLMSVRTGGVRPGEEFWTAFKQAADVSASSAQAQTLTDAAAGDVPMADARLPVSVVNPPGGAEESVREWRKRGRTQQTSLDSFFTK